MKNCFIENFELELINIERAFLKEAKIYFFALDTKIQNFQIYKFFDQINMIMKTYEEINNRLSLDLQDQLNNIYYVRINALILLSNKLFNNENIFEQEYI